MEGRTNQGDSKDPSTDGGETKNWTIPMNQSEEKWEKPHFLGDCEVLKGIKGLI